MKVGVAVKCAVCGLRKKPHGRDASAGIADLCTADCPGYFNEPRAGVLWPGETEEQYGYPVGPHGWREENAP